MKKSIPGLLIALTSIVVVRAAETSSASAIGTIKSIDLKGGTVTVAHEPVPALKWPAMTMPFRLRPEQMAGQ